MAGLHLPTIARGDEDGPLSHARGFLDMLSDRSAQAARFSFDDATRASWNFMGTSIKAGLPIEQMNSDQKAAADVLLRRMLSGDGYDKARLVMACQDVMRDLGRGPASRSSERFSIALFGEPEIGQLWGLRIEGHHLSLSWTLLGDEIVAITPASFSVIPQNIPIGDLKGTVVLDREEGLGRRLIGDLAGAKRKTAIIGEQPPGNILAQAGKEGRFTEKVGIPIADLTSAQQDLLWELIEITTVEPWPPAIAEGQRLRVREGDPASVHFAWAGGLVPGEMFYYRIHGDRFVLEFTSVFGDPEHLHAIFHDPERTLGRHMQA
ncbi:MAG: DUF3500 domain-containing protein [Geminicoccaceae bacterium]